MSPIPKKELPPARTEELIGTLRTRFEQNMNRHPDIRWEAVERRLRAHPDKLWSLNGMEDTGGEPDVVACDQKSGAVTFHDCSPQSPKGRVSVCYDREGWLSRREHRPADTAIDMAEAMGVTLLTETEYHDLQKLGEFDTGTSSWILTPGDIRRRGGALFGDRRFGRVFTYHNGAQSYYSARGFRASLTV